MKTSTSGFTLVELMVIIAMATILFTMAIPSFTSMVRNTRLATQANEFVSDLNLARSEAIKRGERVRVCKSADGTTCTGDGAWTQGWIVEVEGSGELLRARGILREGLALTGNQKVANSVIYRPDGSTANNGSITLCAKDRGVDVIIAMGGRVRTENTSCP